MSACNHVYMIHVLPSDVRTGICMDCQHRHYFMPCCQCGGETKHQFEIAYMQPISLCDGCYFKYQVMRAAGKAEEFIGSCKIINPYWNGRESYVRFGPLEEKPW